MPFHGPFLPGVSGSSASMHAPGTILNNYTHEKRGAPRWTFLKYLHIVVNIAQYIAYFFMLNDPVHTLNLHYMNCLKYS